MATLRNGRTGWSALFSKVCHLRHDLDLFETRKLTEDTALVRWAPMGRGKVTYKDKLRGRNELIADYIEELTGEVRNRKQVSSHIQVLKPFVIHDSFIMKYLSNEQNRWSSGPLDGGESMSNYSVAPSPTEAHDSVVSLNQIEIDVLSEAEDSLETLEPVDFQMFIQRKHSHTQIERLHTYTAALDYPRQPDMQISNWQMLEHDYPLLARIHSQRPLDCAMFQADASLTVEMDSWNDHEDHNLLGEELGIFFLCRSRDLAPNTQISCRNTFYKNGQCLKEHTDRFPLEMVPSDDGSTVEASVKFGSSFWAEILAYLGSRLLEAEHSENIVREEVATYLQGIKVAQEFFSASPRHGQRERLLVIYWKFGLSNGAYGKTSWRRLNLPSLLSLSSTRDVSHSRSQSIDMARVHGKQRIERLLSQQSQLTLPSPLGYESSSGSGLSSSTTWPNSIDDGGMAVPNAQYYGDFTPVEGYDPSLHCGSFDSAGLNYDLETTSFAANLEVGSMDPMRDTSAITWQAGMGHL